MSTIVKNKKTNNFNDDKDIGKHLNLLSLFSGAGGMDLGFEGDFRVLRKSINEEQNPEWISQLIDKNWLAVNKTIFKTVFSNDIRKEAKIVWDNYFLKKYFFPSEIYHLESIVELVKRQKNGEVVFPENIDIITGGFPCQDFSVAGKRLGVNSNKSHTGKMIESPNEENRGQLYIWMREVISMTKPKMFVAENVKGLVNLGDMKKIIEADFAKAAKGGYLVVPAQVLYAPEYGIPQSRERVIFFGFRKDSLKKEAKKELLKEKIIDFYNPYPPKTHGNDKKPFVTCAEAFVGLKEPPESMDVDQNSYSKAKYMGIHCQGQNEVKMNGIGPTIRAEHHGNIEYRRLNIEHGGINQDELREGLEERRLTVRECARLQTFPDDYKFITKEKEKSVSMSDAYRLIGNAVPPLLAYNIAKNLENKWDRWFK